MKRKLLTTLLVVVSVFTCAFGFTACGGFSGDGSGDGDSINNNGGGSSNSGNNDSAGSEQEEKAEFAFGSGSEADPYIINEPYQLLNVSKHLDKCFELSADLNMGDSGTLSAIGTLSAPFTGNFDGKGYTVHSATVSASGYSGLFGVISEATVINLNFKDSFVSITNSETRHLGGFVGLAKMGAEIENCHIDNVKLTAAKRTYSETFYIGGFIGQLSSASKINYCSANTVINVTSWNFKTGGFIGIIDGGAIDACWCKGTVNADGISTIAHVGGFAAFISGGKVSNVLAAMTITADGWVGGIAYSLSASISYAISVCDVRSADKKKDLIYSTSVDYSDCVAFSSANIETANDLLDSDNWNDNAVWQRGTLYPQLVSYADFIAARRHINVIG